MRLFDKLKSFMVRKKTPAAIKNEVAVLGANNGISMSMFSSLYELPEVRTAINIVAEIFSTIPIYHKRESISGSVEYLKSDIYYVLNKMPNMAQCKTQFWITIISQLFKYNNVAIQVVYDENYKLNSIYPLPFRSPMFDKLPFVYFQDDPKNKLYDFENVVLLNRFSTFLGGTKGQATSLYETIITAFQKRAAKNAADPSQINAVLKKAGVNIDKFVKEGDSIAGVKSIKAQQGDNAIIEGMITVPSGYDIVPTDIKDIQIDRDLLNDVINAVYNYFGISKEIVNGVASEIQWQQAIIKTFKPLAMQVGEAFSKTLFSREAIFKGNEIEFDYHDLEIATLESKVRLFTTSVLNGIMNQDECRDKIGLEPIPNGLGQKYRANLNSVDLAVADKYQLSKAGASEKEKGDETKTSNK